MDYSEAVIRLKAFQTIYGPFEAVNVAIQVLENAIQEEDDGK